MSIFSTTRLFTLIAFTSIILVPTNLIAKTEKLWSLSCTKNKTSCSIYGEIKTEKNIVASSFSLQNMQVTGYKEPRMVGVIITPLGLHIPSGVHIHIDDKISFKANLIDCKTTGCRAIFSAEDKIINEMKKGQKVAVTIVDSKSRQGLSLIYSLIGFTETYEKLISSKKIKTTQK